MENAPDADYAEHVRILAEFGMREVDGEVCAIEAGATIGHMKQMLSEMKALMIEARQVNLDRLTPQARADWEGRCAACIMESPYLLDPIRPEPGLHMGERVKPAPVPAAAQAAGIVVRLGRAATRREREFC